MEEYKPNSHKSKETQEAIAEKKVEKVVTGAVKVKKKNGFEKLAGTFVPDDVDNVKSYIMQDIIVPAIKDVILDAVRGLCNHQSRRSGRCSVQNGRDDLRVRNGQRS